MNTTTDSSSADPPRLGPRQRELLDGWRETVLASPSGFGYDFTAPDPREELDAAVDAFLADPTKDAFADFWRAFRRTTTPYGYVLGQWTESLAQLAEWLDSVRDADRWDPAWAERFGSHNWLYELFTRTHESLPVVDSYSQHYLRRFGIRAGEDFESLVAGMERFRAAYEDAVGHVTAGTEHEVPVRRELDELFALLHEFPKDDVPARLLGREKPVYEPLIGFEATSDDGGRIELDVDLVERAVQKYVEGIEAGAYGVDDSLPEAKQREHWCGTYDEEWKHEAADAVSGALREDIEATELDAADLERVVDAFDEGHGVISQPVIEYLLGPSQGWRVWGAFKERTRENPENAAAVLSRFFDPEAEYVTGRLELFKWYYGDDDALKGGSLMKLATGLLMLAWPERYVLYQHRRCKAFFGDVCVSSFEVDTGYNPGQYHRINAAAREVRDRLDDRLDRKATLCDVQSMIYFWKDEPL